jgi:3,4-dihydroxy 2-butanone 4-phosphate synthase/GTP cyclohydrolase II
MVILVDDPDRENEGDLVAAAEKITPEQINFMATHGRGLICLTLTEEKSHALGLAPMVPDNTSRFGTAFTVSIDARRGVTTGISAADRAHTVRTAVASAAQPADLVRPGHVFPLVAKAGGVLRRSGQTEGSVDLARLAGLEPAGVICEVMNEDGTMARLPDLERFAERHRLKLCSVVDLIRHRHAHERLIERVTATKVPTSVGDFTCHLYKSSFNGHLHLAFCCGQIRPLDGRPGSRLDRPVLVRVHSECLTGDIFGSLRCDCGFQLRYALEQIQKEGEGILLYIRQEGRGIGLENKLKAYALQDSEGLDTVEANERLGFKPDERDYGTGAQILADLGVRKMRLLTNNPGKYGALEGYGLEIVERVPILAEPNPYNARYLATKREKLGHYL